MAKQRKAKASKAEITAYLQMLGKSGEGLNINTLDLDKSMNLVNTETGEIEFNFEGFSKQQQDILCPPVANDGENDFMTETKTVEAVNEDDFENTSSRPVVIDFWNYKETPVIVGIFLGEGRSVKKRKTYLFFNPISQQYFITGSWQTLSYFENASTHPQFKYQLVYTGYVEAKGGKDGFHKVTVNKGKAPVATPHNADLTNMISPLPEKS